MSLAQRLKRLRENRMLSVRDLADAVGVSRSFIYQLERGEVSPSYSTLRGISRVLGTTVSVLVGDAAPEQWLVVRREDRKRLILGDSAPEAAAAARVELLPFLGTRNRRMQPVVIDLPSGAVLDPLPFEHEHEQLLIVTTGMVTVAVDGGSEFTLRAGDSAYLLFERAHRLHNISSDPAGLVLVVSPPG